MFQGLGCSPIKAVRELGSERRETVRSISGVGVRALRGPFPSTRGPGRTHLWCASYRAHEPPVAQPRQRWVLCPSGDGAKEVLRIQEKASPKVTEACKGFLGPDGDWPSSAKAEGSLTARPTRRAGTKVGLSDPTVPSGRAVAQRIKVTLGITG
ncbi:hypothetical protein DEO72_LG11g2182 [Vigna unguiculata]|uniref:Uncharacterized protein n=1 Tax=Vigna unguiculata TaxID=3917 RepID=A0A4D6NMW7_VIGUN|nr:hypothetical protein DEO72_LG11g2182 [Vigna unguiculata]